MKEEPTNVLKLENMTDSKTIVHQDEDLGLVTLIINVTLPNGEITRVEITGPSFNVGGLIWSAAFQAVKRGILDVEELS
jgi:hypothetical protein